MYYSVRNWEFFSVFRTLWTSVLNPDRGFSVKTDKRCRKPYPDKQDWLHREHSIVFAVASKQQRPPGFTHGITFKDSSFGAGNCRRFIRGRHDDSIPPRHGVPIPHTIAGGTAKTGAPESRGSFPARWFSARRTLLFP